MSKETTSLPKTMRDVMEVLPKDAFKIDPFIAWTTAARVWLTVIFSYYVLSITPWYLLPFSWIFVGTALTGLFVVGHDCAHQSFSNSKFINEIVGTICMMPLAFPYNCWDMTHSHHHAHANNLEKDHLWRPFTRDQVKKMPKWKKYLNYYMFGPLFFQSSIFHHAYHFIIPFVTKRNREATLRSIAFAIVGGIISIYISIQLGSFFKYWLVPFCVFQFWLSTFTYFHHRLPPKDKQKPVGWKPTEEWTKVYGGLFATVHVDYPTWIEFLTLDINWHLPHHVSPRIPWYRLRKCTYALLQEYGDNLHTAELNWDLWKETTTQTHLYDEIKGYAPMIWD